LIRCKNTQARHSRGSPCPRPALLPLLAPGNPRSAGPGPYSPSRPGCAVGFCDSSPPS
jgi:hypothetical protein